MELALIFQRLLQSLSGTVNSYLGRSEATFRNCCGFLSREPFKFMQYERRSIVVRKTIDDFAYASIHLADYKSFNDREIAI
jgi:hypothetical protein